MRKNPEYGTAYISVGEKTLKIEGREIYETEAKDEIKVLKNDPEIMEDTTTEAQVEEASEVEVEEPKKSKK